ncbi:MAG TPA: ectonucleotide pyrophosphatase/phosphodiesterase, partial [Candidatus Limnocylindria bacterium]|nr:ectonucleotide pyrophosphatase/phosphodiesterase [Candidatus Limnocylindria bacterium]
MRIVLISLDAVFAADSAFLLTLPALGRLAREGVFCGDMRTVYPSLTYPAHTTFVTGCYPDRHGIGHNGPFLPSLPPASRPWYWDAKDIRVPTLFTQAAKAGRECAAILWPVTGHARHIRWNFPEVLALPGESQILKVLSYGSAMWLLGNELRFGRRRRGAEQPFLDDYATAVAESLIRRQYAPQKGLGRKQDVKAGRRDALRHMPDLLALHLVDCDAMRHQYGTFSQEAKDALTRLDDKVGRVIRALEEREALDATVLAVVTDHGQDDITGTLPLDAWLKANGVPARAQSLGFGAYLRMDRGDYLPVLDAIQRNMAELRLARVYTREDLRAMHAPEDVLLAVEPQAGLAVVDGEDDEPHAATHGFGPDHPGTRCLMWLRGPGIRKGWTLPGCG